MFPISQCLSFFYAPVVINYKIYDYTSSLLHCWGAQKTPDKIVQTMLHSNILRKEHFFFSSCNLSVHAYIYGINTA